MKTIVDKYQREPFVWGKTDCCRFVCECVESVTGRDLASKFTWHDHASAKELVGSFGSLYNLVAHELGQPGGDHKDGDVCLTTYLGEELLGVVYGEKGLFRTEQGIASMPMASILYCWST